MPVLPLALAAIRLPAFLCAPDGTIVEANDLAEALAGRPLAGCTLASAVGIFDHRSGAGAPLMAGELPVSQALRGEETVDVPLVVTAADGRTLHILANAGPIRDGDRVVGALSVWQDVSAFEADRACSETAAAELEMQEEELRQQGGELVRTVADLDWERLLLDGILGALPHQISVWDRENRLVWANARFAAVRGLSGGAAAGRTWHEVWGDAPMADQLARESERAMAAGAPISLDLNLTGPDGQAWWVCPYRPIFGDSRLVIIEDSTERQRVEAALRESEAKYRRLVDDAITGDFISAPDGRILDCNSAFARMFGFGSIEEAKSVNIVETYVNPAERAELLDRLRREGRLEYDERFRRQRDGTRIHVVENIIGDFDDRGALREIRGYVIDDNQRYRAEEALQRSEATMARAQETARLGNWEWDMKRNLLTCSDEHCRIYGLAPGEYPIETYVNLVHEDDRQYIMKSLAATLEEGIPYNVECRIVRPDGSLRIVHGEGEAVFDEKGRPMGLFGIAQDITDRKRVEDALRETRDFLESLINHANAPIIVWDPELRITRFNAAFERLTGYPADEVIGRDLSMLFPEESRDESLEKIQHTFTEHWESVEIPVIWRDGEIRVALWNSANIYDSGGTTLRATIAQGQDITERRRVEEELRQAYEHNTAVLESISDSFLALDRGWRFTYINSRALGYSGKSPADVIGRALPEVFPEIIGTPLEAFYRAAMDSREPLTFENRSVAAPGRTFELRAYPTERGISVFGRDITERKQAEEALRESEELLRLAQENANVAVWDLDVRTGRQTYTPEFLQLYGVEEDCLRRYERWREHVHPDDIDRVEAERNAALARGETFDISFRTVRSSGEVRWIAMIGRGVRDAGGNLLRIMGVNLDITGRKEDELRIARYADDLARSNEELQRFAYVASHDLQEPLRSIISFSQLLERRYRGQLDRDADEFIAFIVEGGTRMQRLIEDLLQLSRIETTGVPLVPTDSGGVVAGALRLMETSIREAGATVVVGNLPTVMADGDQLEQVFTNLVGNALKYRRPDVPPAIRISAERESRFWQFAVADNGIGIEAEYFDRIFVIFQRLHSRDAYEGTGIGLAVVRKIIDRHGGRIWVESTPGEGSTFLFTLPAA